MGMHCLDKSFAVFSIRPPFNVVDAQVVGLRSKGARSRSGAKKALAEIWNAEDRDHAQAAANVFAADYGTKWSKAAAKITDDLDVLLAFYDYPAEHWIHLRTTNPIWVNRPRRGRLAGAA